MFCSSCRAMSVACYSLALCVDYIDVYVVGVWFYKRFLSSKKRKRGLVSFILIRFSSDVFLSIKFMSYCNSRLKEDTH
jgi:hypothetical protein